VHARASDSLPWRLALLGLCTALWCPRAAAQELNAPSPALSLQLSPALGSADSAPAAAIDLAEPVPGARISSPFGWRIHPILKVLRFHNGVDYAAPLGTPVRAAASGVVEAIGRRRDFGLFLRIRHSGIVETAYSHLARYVAGLRPGSTVSRGQVIAEVGRTGWATGPHLFYEVIVNGSPVDPTRQDWWLPMGLPVAAGTW
jgi:murein DD-endopeptidase MepM/ murein hydrolase activator NlpD